VEKNVPLHEDHQTKRRTNLKSSTLSDLLGIQVEGHPLLAFLLIKLFRYGETIVKVLEE